MIPGKNRTPWYDQKSKGKIFGIGLTKTGTMSLADALKILGYKTKHYPWSLEEIDEHEASTDIPISCRYKELDVMYPNSKFILTTRSFESWIKTTSQKPPDKFKPPLWKIETRLKIYGSLHWDKEYWTRAFTQHHNEVRNYFKNRSKDYIEISLENVNKWEILCNFLNKKIPQEPYPRKNRSPYAIQKIF
jgi:hypothetical protein